MCSDVINHPMISYNNEFQLNVIGETAHENIDLYKIFAVFLTNQFVVVFGNIVTGKS